MMLLSTSLASLGLLADSTAVVIGAMLVAPLMGPLVAAGHALVQGNLSMFKRSMVVTLIGLGIGFTASLFFGAINPGFEPTLEIEARGKPDLLDLGIAFFSGMTAAYAVGRFNVMINPRRCYHRSRTCSPTCGCGSCANTWKAPDLP